MRTTGVRIGELDSRVGGSGVREGQEAPANPGSRGGWGKGSDLPLASGFTRFTRVLPIPLNPAPHPNPLSRILGGRCRGLEGCPNVLLNPCLGSSRPFSAELAHRPVGSLFLVRGTS